MIPLAIRKIENKEGEYFEVKENERLLPAKVTNFALKYGIDKGIINSSDPSMLFVKVEEDYNLALSVIYLGLVGANPPIVGSLTFEEFSEQLDVEWGEVAYTAQKILVNELPETLLEYIGELEAKTANFDDNNKKK